MARNFRSQGPLRVEGGAIVDGEGGRVLLRGVGLGGWLNMENFITGYPATESLQRAALRAALGEEGYRRFFGRLLPDLFAAPHARHLASLRLHTPRGPFRDPHLQDADPPLQL